MINKKIDVISDTYLKKSENNITQSIDNVKQTKMNITKVDEFNNSRISLNRKILSWEWYTEIKTFKLFIHCLLRANWEDKNYRGIIIKRGQFLTSIAKLSVETGLGFQEVRTALKHLILTSELTKQAYSQYSIITVNKYNEYQTKFKKLTSEETSDQQTTNKQLTTNNNKNNKNNNEYLFIEKEKNSKKDPYINPIKSKFEKIYYQYFHSKPYLNHIQCNKLIEFSNDIENFEDKLPEILEKMSKITFEIRGTEFKPKASWLFKEDNLQKILTGEMDGFAEEKAPETPYGDYNLN